MRRRRLSRRIPGRLPHIGPLRAARLQAGSLRALRRANRLLEVGDHANAAAIFVELADAARDLGMDNRAPFLFFQAARAFFLSNQPDAGMNAIREGLEILAQSGQTERLQISGVRLVDELDQLGFTDAATRVKNLIEKYGVTASVESIQEKVDRTPELPLKCPNCGATIRPDSVEWIDSRNAVCAYCGSVIREE